MYHFEQIRNTISIVINFPFSHKLMSQPPPPTPPFADEKTLSKLRKHLEGILPAGGSAEDLNNFLEKLAAKKTEIAHALEYPFRKAHTSTIVKRNPNVKNHKLTKKPSFQKRKN